MLVSLLEAGNLTRLTPSRTRTAQIYRSFKSRVRNGECRSPSTEWGFCGKAFRQGLGLGLRVRGDRFHRTAPEQKLRIVEEAPPT